MAVNVKLGVDLGDFNSGIKSAKEQLKTFDAALKYAEASLKATGDAESAMTTKTEALRGKLQTQKQMVDQYTEALKKMRDAGVDKTSSAYQKMQTNLLNAQAAMMTTKAQINELNTSQTNAAKSANDLATNVSKIGKNVSLQTLSDGLSKLTNSLERGARTAIRLGRNIARSAMGSTEWADDLTTRSTQYGVDVETLQRMDRVAQYIDTDVDTIISARDRMSKNRESLAELLGISSDGKTVDDVFWEAGEKLKNMGEGFDQNEAAMKIFGRSWRELLPLFTAGREEYEALLNSQNVLSKEQIEKLAKADDAFQSVQQQAQMMVNQFWADNADKITGLLQWIVDNKGPVVAAITAIGGAFAAMKLGEVALDIAKVVNGLKGLTGGGKDGTPTTTGTGTPTVLPNGGVNGGGTTLAFGGGFAEGLANFMTSKTGMLTIGGLMLTPIITKLANGTLIEDPAKAAGIDANTADLFNRALNGGKVPIGGGASAQKMYNALTGGKAVEVPVEAKTEGDEAAKIAAQIGTVSVPIRFVIHNGGSSAFGGGAGGGGGGQADYFMDTLFGSFRPGYANGIAYVPNKRLAWLHPGETVTPARAVESRSYNSNLYVERMIMNNGTDAAGLASAMAAAQRRTMSGYGS